MAAIAFDTLKAARRLKEVGVPEAQAETQAELMAEAFVFNMDALVTRDYLDHCLDARFAAQEKRLDERFAAQEKRLDERFARWEKQINARFDKQDARFDKQDARFDKQEARFGKQDARFDKQDARLADHDLQFAEIRGELKLHRWMLAIIAASTVIPALQKLFTLLTG